MLTFYNFCRYGLAKGDNRKENHYIDKVRVWPETRRNVSCYKIKFIFYSCVVCLSFEFHSYFFFIDMHMYIY